MSLRPPPGWDAPPLPPRGPTVLRDDAVPFFPEPGATPAPPLAQAPFAYGADETTALFQAPAPGPTDAGTAYTGTAYGPGSAAFGAEPEGAGDRATPVMGTLGGPDPYGAHSAPLVPPAATLADVPMAPPVAAPFPDAPPPLQEASHFIVGTPQADPLAGVVTPTETATAVAPPKPKVRLGLIVGVTVFALVAAALAGFFVLRTASTSTTTEESAAGSATAKPKRKKTPAASSSAPHAVGTLRPRRPRAAPSHATPPPPATHDAVPMDPDGEGDTPPPSTPTDQPRPYAH